MVFSSISTLKMVAEHLLNLSGTSGMGSGEGTAMRDSTCGILPKVMLSNNEFIVIEKCGKTSNGG